MSDSELSESGISFSDLHLIDPDEEHEVDYDGDNHNIVIPYHFGPYLVSETEDESEEDAGGNSDTDAGGREAQ